MRSKAETKRIVARHNFLKKLLAENGLILSGWEPGVLAIKKTGLKTFDGKDHCISLNFERAEWGWIETVLLELRRLRKQCGDRSADD